MILYIIVLILKFGFVDLQRRNDYNQGRKVRLAGRAYKAQREDSIRRTVYVSDIDQTVSYILFQVLQENVLL